MAGAAAAQETVPVQPSAAVTASSPAPSPASSPADALTGLGGALPAEDANLHRTFAELRWLDKVTGRVQTADVPINRRIILGTLQFVVHDCVQRPPEDPPESAAFLDVAEVKPGQPTTAVFKGWMFASSPALSAMQHPVYDLWVLDCKGDTVIPAAPVVTQPSASAPPSSAPASN